MGLAIVCATVVGENQEGTRVSFTRVPWESIQQWEDDGSHQNKSFLNAIELELDIICHDPRSAFLTVR
jgi:hypothetical protein